MKTIDLRSDTVTRPTAGMRDAMARAEVGDDVYGEDPSVNRLQEVAAQLVGKETALFVPSGTMANQVALRALTRPGDVVLAGQGAHILRYEGGAAAALWGLQIQTIGERGLFDPDSITDAMPALDVHCAPVRVVAIENTHNGAGGVAWPWDRLRAVTDRAASLGLGLHLDGARLFNAAEASGVPVARLAEPFDTVSFCLSKGLGAPVGSLVCTERARIQEVLRGRKILGGGMRQAGVLAAAGLYALEHHIERLRDDHANARHLAAGLRALGLGVESEPETNIVMFRVHDAAKFAQGTRERGLLINPFDSKRFRAVTHLDVSERDIEDALERIEASLAN